MGLETDRRRRNQQEPADPGECHQGVGGRQGKHFIIIFPFHFVLYSLGCGATCDSSDILA